jgi:hypothetical protein
MKQIARQKVEREKQAMQLRILVCLTALPCAENIHLKDMLGKGGVTPLGVHEIEIYNSSRSPPYRF